jgi:hypothetical protein
VTIFVPSGRAPFMLRLRRSRGDAQHEREVKSHERLPFALSVP